MATPPCLFCPQQSVYYCSCQNPAIPCCHTCSYVHHDTPGVHNWAMFQLAEAKNVSCEVCQERTAEVVCCCKFPLTPLCLQCRSAHAQKEMAMHLEQPIEKANMIKSLDDIEKARKVLGNKDRIEKYLGENKTALTKLKDEVTVLAGKLTARINSAKEETLKEITKTEREIDEKTRILKQTVQKYLFQVEVQYSDLLLREAFDISKDFSCPEIVKGELFKESQISPLLVQLRLPPYLKVSAVKLQPSSERLVAAANDPRKRVDMQSTNPSLSVDQLLPAANPEASATGNVSGNQQASQPQMRQFSSPEFEYHQGGSQTMASHRQGNPMADLSANTQAIPCISLPQQHYALVQTSSTLPAQSVKMQDKPGISSQVCIADSTGQAQQSSLETNHFEITQEMINIVHAPCREDFSSRIPEIPLTIGRHRLPIVSLLEEVKLDELMRQQPQALAGKFSTWRRCRGDGNSFYRCVGVLLSEHYCCPDTPVQEVAHMYKAMLEQRQPFVLMSDSTEVLSHLKLWYRMLRDIYTTIIHGENALQRLQYFLQRPRFDKAIIIAMRNFTAAYCKMHTKDPDVSAALLGGLEPVIREIMEYGKEAEGIALKFTAQTFNIILHILTLDVKTGQIVDTAYGPAIEGYYPSMHLIHLSGHYDYLVPRFWDVADGYDFASNTYNATPTLVLVDYEKYVPT